MAFHSALLDVVSDIPFEIYKVTTPFNPTCSLSEVDLNLETCEDESGNSIVIRAGELFELEQLVPTPENREVFKFIKNARSKPWPPFSTKPLSERNVLVKISQHLFIPLCRGDEVILEKKYSTLISNLGPDAAGMRTDHIGLGSWKTWHGTPDARVRESEVISRKVSHDVEEYEEYDNDGGSTADSCGTDGATSSNSRFSLSQVVATSVVSSFTESKLHPGKQPLVLTILINLTQIQVCFYDCRLDVLLISRPKLLTNNGGLSRSAVLFLWLAINHR